MYIGLPGGSLVPMPARAQRFSETDEGELDERLDLAVMPYGVSEEGGSSCRFLGTESMELSHQVNPVRRALREYLVFGYSVARSQVQIDHHEKHIKQTSLQLTTSAAEPGKYLAHGLSSADQLVLDYDHERIDVDGSPTNMPQLQGVSGGGVFHLPIGGPARLVAVATEHLKPKRLIVATQVAHVVRLARHLIDSEDPRVFL
jgi:hypothetical protein